jgi:hypothetical protein
MRGDGRLVDNGYRFNPMGFEAMAKLMSSGLVSIFNELSGETPRKWPNLAKLSDDIAAAVSIYNTTLQVRFDVLRERTLLVNHQEKAIEGFLGLDHRMLDNTEFFDIVSDAILDSQPSAQFYRAEIVGRELRLYFIDSNSRRSDLHPDANHTFASGWYFSNREDAGQAVRGALCLYTKFGVAFEPAESKYKKVVHAGADLSGRTAVLATRTAARSIDMREVAEQVRKLLSTPLKFSDKKSEFDAAIKYWVNYLSKFKIKTDTATDIIKNASTVGSDLKPRDITEVYTKSAMESRTAYDLMASILRCSKNEYGTFRDALQGVAMQLLVPDKKLAG